MHAGEPILIALQLTTESLLAWVIVAIGVLGFIIAHIVERWYKALLPALLALVLIAFGLYCVITIAHQDKQEQDEGTEPAKTGDLDTILSTDVKGLSDDLEEVVEPPPVEDLAANLAATVPRVQNNPFYISDDQSLKVTVRLRNTGSKPISRASVQVYVPRKSGQRGWMDAPEPVTFDQPLGPGAERDVTVTVEGVGQPDDVAQPQVRVTEAS